MSFLAPLYILAMGAISLPILFHLIRRTPRGRMVFSSLMFLTPSPPRLTRRSRLDELLLLLLRAAAVILLALAFARPFLREAARLTFDSTRGRRVAVVLDTSASMQRGDLWNQALRQIRDELDAVEDGDDVALFTFDEQVRTVVDFESRKRISGREKATLVRQQLDSLKPGWGQTSLGAALLTAADALTISNDLQQSESALQILLVSDLQEGAQLEALQSYEWPQDVFVQPRIVGATERSNATLRIVTSEEESHEQQVRVRITNNPNSNRDQYYLRWEGDDVVAGSDQDLAIYVPAGQSTIVQVPRPDSDVMPTRLVLSGDDDAFDNQYFTVPLRREDLLVGYIGDDTADDPDGLRYYLELALSDTFRRAVDVVPLAASERLEFDFETPRTADETAPFGGAESSRDPDAPPEIIVVAQPVSPPLLVELEQYLRQGGCLLTVLQEEETAIQLASLVRNAEVIGPAADRRAEDYVMLGEIDFTHPVLAVFAKPQYSDFTKIHFWNHVRLQLDDNPGRRVLARFDDGSPALWEQRLGEGRLFVLTSGWRPADSQLALSTKFVPLVTGILEQATQRPAVSPEYQVNEPVRLPPREANAQVTRPDGEIMTVAKDAEFFRAADQPGLYRLAFDDRQQTFAVNLAARESEVSPLEIERLEQLGVRVGVQATRSEEIERQRQLRDMELEGHQRLWQWLIAAGLVLLCLETWLAGRRAREATRASSAPEEGNS